MVSRDSHSRGRSTNRVYDSEIGEAVIELTNTDVALVKLNEGVQFINEPFENTLLPTPAKLVGFRDLRNRESEMISS